MLNWILEKLGFIAPKVAPQAEPKAENVAPTDDKLAVETVELDLQAIEPTTEKKRVRKARQTNHLKQRKTAQKKM